MTVDDIGKAARTRLNDRQQERSQMSHYSSADDLRDHLGIERKTMTFQEELKAILIQGLVAQRKDGNFCRMDVWEPDEDPDSAEHTEVSIKGEINMDELSAFVAKAIIDGIE